MNGSLSERRLAENEVVFRQYNLQVQEELEAYTQAAESEGHKPQASVKDLPLHFYCECSDESCKKRIVLKPNEYKKLHKNSSQFLILPGHQVASIEKVVRQEKNFTVVEKYMTPPKHADKLNPSNIKND